MAKTQLPSAVAHASGPRQALTVQASVRPAKPSHGYWQARTIATNTLVVTPGKPRSARKGLTVAELKALVKRTANQAPRPQPHPFPVVSANIHKPYPATPSLSPYLRCSK